MPLIETTAPIELDELKLFFNDKETFYMIHYEESKLQGSKLLTYLGNLELPCDIGFTTQEGFDEMTQAYLHANFIVNIPILETRVIELLLEMKGITELVEKEFIDANLDILKIWAKKLDSLSLYNLYTIESPEFKDYVTSFPEDSTKELEGVNFVSLLKNERFFMFYGNVIEEHKTYYKSYFNEYMFKGNNLYSYWANENNPMFLLTHGIATGAIQENKNATSV
jgi:hypothetical protein